MLKPEPDDREFWRAVHALVVAVGRALLKFARYLEKRHRLGPDRENGEA